MIDYVVFNTTNIDAEKEVYIKYSFINIIMAWSRCVITVGMIRTGEIENVLGRYTNTAQQHILMTYYIKTIYLKKDKRPKSIVVETIK